VAQTLAHIIRHCISSVCRTFCSLSTACGLCSVTLSSLSQDSNSPVLVSQTSQIAMPLSLSMIAQSKSILHPEGKPLRPFLISLRCSHPCERRRRTADGLRWCFTESAIALQTRRGKQRCRQAFECDSHCRLTVGHAGTGVTHTRTCLKK